MLGQERRWCHVFAAFGRKAGRPLVRAFFQDSAQSSLRIRSARGWSGPPWATVTRAAIEPRSVLHAILHAMSRRFIIQGVQS
ncbi:hypothetical protein [uncultured Methylobacterium sp.]|jgi:hypothetical protein|uniref:hypothetical protein n=1 Tax=uncultured Methylobacterium sp. TaxID=157278 RepID=UPI0035CAACF2